jgi:hypothetical protein
MSLQRQLTPVGALPQFTTDWFSRRIPTWRRVLSKFRDRPTTALEIGSFEGRSATFLLNYLPQSHLTCIDPFVGSYEERFDQNLAPFAARCRKIKARSAPALDELNAGGCRFDVIYIDGSHKRQDVLCDSVQTWPMLNVGGIMIWDDWRFGRKSRPSEERPQHAIDMFCRAFSPCLKVLHWEYQVMVEKRSEWPLPGTAAAIGTEVRYRVRRWLSKVRSARARTAP